MEIFTKAKLRLLCKKYPSARKSIETWCGVMENCSAVHLIQLRKTFGTADPVGTNKEKTCFNIKGNDFRLNTEVDYKSQEVFILEFLKHDEYDTKYNR